MNREKFEDVIKWIIAHKKLPQKEDEAFCDYHNICKAWRGGFHYKWHPHYDDVMNEYNVDYMIFETSVRRHWIELLSWVQDHGRKPRASNSAIDKKEYRLGNLWARTSRSKWGRCGNRWDPWYDEMILEYSLTEILEL